LDWWENYLGQVKRRIPQLLDRDGVEWVASLAASGAVLSSMTTLFQERLQDFLVELGLEPPDPGSVTGGLEMAALAIMESAVVAGLGWIGSPGLPGVPPSRSYWRTVGRTAAVATGSTIGAVVLLLDAGHPTGVVPKYSAYQLMMLGMNLGGLGTRALMTRGHSAASGFDSSEATQVK
jgi:hypothetical protein